MPERFIRTLESLGLLDWGREVATASVRGYGVRRHKLRVYLSVRLGVARHNNPCP